MTNMHLLIALGSCLVIFIFLLWSLLQQLVQSIALERLIARVHKMLPATVRAHLEVLWLRSHQYDTTGSNAVQTYSRWLLHRVLLVIGFVTLLIMPQPNSQRLILVMIGGAWLLHRLHRRRYWNAQIERQWPATIDIYAMLLLSGLSQRAAIYAMAELTKPTRATWLLQRVQRDIQTGTDLEEALNHLSEAYPIVWIRHFVTASIQSLRYGSQLAETLLNQADEARQKQIMDAEKRAQEVGVKLLFPLLFCFFPVTFLIILGPLFLRFLHGG